MVDTLGGFSGLMVGPLRQLLEQKGYRPVGARQIVMPGNYLFVKPREACEKRITKGLRQAERYAQELLDGTARWRRLSHIPYRWVHSFWEKVERSANRDGLKFKVNEVTCTKCGLCSRLCPVANIVLKEYPRFGGACQQCQRCIAYCPARAITHSALANGRYHAVPAADLLTPP